MTKVHSKAVEKVYPEMYNRYLYVDCLIAGVCPNCGEFLTYKCKPIQAYFYDHLWNCTCGFTMIHTLKTSSINHADLYERVTWR